MSLRVPTVAALAVIALLAIACAPATPAAPPPAATAVAVATNISEVKSDLAIANSEWQLETLFPPPAATPVAPGTDATLGFGVDRYSGFGGCDWFMGMYNVNGSELSMQQPAKMIAGCVNKPEATDQQGTYMSMLTNATSYEIKEGKLILYTTDKQQLMTLVPLEAVPFEGTTWDMLFYFSPQNAVWVPAVPGAEITAKFDGATLSGNAGCNDYSASYKREGDRLTLDAITSTKKMCETPDGVMEQEQGYLEMLSSAKVIAQYPRSIELLTLDMTPLLAFHAQ